MKPNRTLLVAAIASLLLVVAGIIFIRRKRNKTQSDHQQPIDI